MRTQSFKTKLFLINNVIHWFRPAIFVDDRSFPVFIKELNVHYDIILCVLLQKKSWAIRILFYIHDAKFGTMKIVLTTGHPICQRRTNLHFLQHEFCSRHWVHLFSTTGEFTFRKECTERWTAASWRNVVQASKIKIGIDHSII